MSIGGAENYIRRVAPILRHHGVVLDVCAMERAGPLLVELEGAGITVHGTRFIRRHRPPMNPVNVVVVAQTVADIRRLIRREQYDAVHTYLFQADVVGVVAARLAGSDRVIVSRRNLHAWRHGANPIEHGTELGLNLMAHELIANSWAVMRDAERHEAFLPPRRTVIYNGLDVSQYRPGQPGRRRGQLKMVVVGALSPRKGQEYAIAALSLLRSAGVDASLVLVGAGPDEPKLLALVARESLGDQVVFVGQADPRPHLEAADLFLMPSRQEGFSNALLEAMATALPVVATDVGGNAEALIDGEGGRVVPPEDPIAMADAVTGMAANRDDLFEMGRRNRVRVEREFTIERSARALADWYMLGPRASSPATSKPTPDSGTGVQSR
jgi:glycosyltransferase involved in cell wall biosynthesis